MIQKALAEKDTLVGTFVKTPATEIVEVLATTPLDFICLDAEHAGWDRRSLDQCLAMALALGLPALVRIAVLRPELILQALDGGAAGIIAPHIRTAQDAADLVRWANFGPGGRGYSGSTRSAGFRGRKMADVLDAADPFLIAQIEDAEALGDLAEISATPGLGALFIGRADLAVSLDASNPKDTVVQEAAQTIRTAAARAGLPVAVFAATAANVETQKNAATRMIFWGSDQASMAHTFSIEEG